MEIECPKCGYIRTQKDDPTIPTTVCPSCSIVYSKFNLSNQVDNIPIKNRKTSPEKSEQRRFSFSLSKILAWILGAFFILTGIAALFSGNFILSVCYLFTGILLMPITDKWIKEKHDIELSGKAKFIIIIVVFISTGFLVQVNSPDQAKDKPFLSASEYRKSFKRLSKTQKVNPLTFVEIINNVEGKTDLQTENYFNTLKNTRVMWTGEVIDADSNLIGKDCYIDLKIPGTGLLDSVRLYVDCDSASQVNKKQKLKFDGRIKGIVDLMGVHAYISDPSITIY